MTIRDTAYQLTEKEVFDQENKLHMAIKKGDIDALDELLHDDLLFVVPGGEVITKAIDLNTYRNGLIKIAELLPYIENLNIIDDLAVLTLTIELKGTFRNEPFEVTYRYIRFWKKLAQGIKVVGGSGTAID